MRLDISMHYALAVAKIQRLQELEYIVPDIVIDESRVKRPEVRVIHVLENQAGGLALAITNDIQQRDDIGSARQILQDLDLSLDLLFLHRLQHLDNAFLIVDNVNPFEYFRVLSPTYPP